MTGTHTRGISWLVRALLVGVATALFVGLPAVESAADPVCRTSYSDELSSSVYVYCTDTTTETETTTERTTETVPTTIYDTTTVYEDAEPVTVTETTTETTTIPTTVTETTTIPTTVDRTVEREVPTTVEQTVDHTQLSTIVQDRPGPTTYFAQYITQNLTETQTAWSTSTAYDQVQVTWALATAVNPATGRTPAVSVSRSQATAGGSVDVSVDGFTPGEQVRIELHSTPVLLGTVTAGADGTANSTVTIPVGTDAGQHTITVVGVTCGIQASIPITVVAPAADEPVASLAAFDPAGRSLSYTGANTGWAVSLGAALLVGGFGLVLLGRRRQARTGGAHLVSQEPADLRGRHRA
jgi:LPXTG-motif cell wall-anchored protein